MLSKEIIIERIKASYPYLGAEYGVKRIGLFGSFAQDRANEASDIDVLVEFQRPLGFKFFNLVEDLEKLLGRKVDVLTPAGLQSIRVNGIANNIRESILYL